MGFRKQREECPISDLWISVKCGELITSGLASNPTVGNLMDKLEPLEFICVLGKHQNLQEQKKFVLQEVPQRKLQINL